MYFFSAEDKTKAAEHRRSLDRLEGLERELCDIVGDEVTEIVGIAKIADPDEIKTLMQHKDNAAKTMLLMQRISQYTGIKRGVLPRDHGSGNEPRNDIKEAERIVSMAEKRLNRDIK